MSSARVPSLANLGMTATSKPRTGTSDDEPSFFQLELDLLPQILKKAYPHPKDAVKYCGVNKQSDALCNNEEFWETMCYEWKFGGPGSLQNEPWHKTKFTQTFGHITHRHMWWKMWFRYCAELVHDNDTLREAVKQTLEENEDGSSSHSKYGPIHTWDTSQVTDMQEIFADATEFNQDIGKWDVSNVTNMSEMFQGAKAFNKYIGEWDVGNVRDMSGMFWRARSFNEDISKWNVSNVEDMSCMFEGAKKFNKNIAEWNVSNVEDMAHMFTCLLYTSPSPRDS